MKKFIATLLLITLVFTLGVSAFADEDSSGKGKVSAVAIVKEGPGLPLVADAYTLRMTKNASGASCDEELGEIPSTDVVYFTQDQLDLMPEESRRQFEEQLELVKQMDPDMVKYLFWIELTGDSAGKVGEQKDGSKVVLDMWFSDYEGVDLYAMENGHDADLQDSIRNGNFRLTLEETGAVVITTKAVRIVAGMMEIVTEEEIEGKKIWVNSPYGHWEVDPSAPSRKVSHSEFVPTFDREEYEIMLVIAKKDIQDELVVKVPVEDMYVMTLDQIDILTEEAQDNFLREYEKVRDDTENVVQYFFYIDLSDEYRDLVGKQEDGSVQYLLLCFSGDRDDYIVTSNGKPMETYVSEDENEAGTFYIKLTELGALAIKYPDVGTDK